MKRLMALLLPVVIGMWLLGSGASATPLPVGGSVFPGACPGAGCPDPGTVLASGTTHIPTATFDADVYAEVHQEAGGTLDFYYQVQTHNGSVDPVGRLSTSAFSNFTTDVFYKSIGVNDVAPDSADRTTNAVVGFSFLLGVPGGSQSALLIVKTNATAFDDRGTVALIDRSVGSGLSFEPISGVPEPTSIFLLGGLVSGLAVLLRRRLRGTL